MYTIEEFDKAKTKILKYIIYKKRSENEIRKKFSKEFDENLILASRNLKNLVLILADEINVLDIVGTDVMVVTEDALKFIEEVLK